MPVSPNRSANSDSGYPDQSEVLGYLDALSNWDRWGPNDTLGTLNYITKEVRRAAAAEVRSGITVSCAHDITDDPPTDAHYQRSMIKTGEGVTNPDRIRDREIVPGIPTSPTVDFAVESLTLTPHGSNTTHYDALSHYFLFGHMYGGHPAHAVTSQSGALRLDVRGARNGIVTRGVLLDIPLLLGFDWLPASHSVDVATLERAEKKFGFTVGPGDALLLRTGHSHPGRRPTPTTGQEAGWQASVLPWLHERQVAVIASDASNDVLPSGYPELPVPIHAVGLTAMGLAILDNLDLETLSRACRTAGRYTFQFVVAPLRFQGATGSPVNPLANL